jgi:hypothetical protein
MIPNSLLPRKGENEKIFTHLGEVVLGVRGQGSGVRSQGAWVVSNLFCFDLAKDVALKDAR